jgi:hypothetical protein
VAKKTVEIRLAFSFTCLECGQETFVNSVVHEFSPEEQADMADDLGEKPQTGYWLTHPENVSCKHCGAQFIAINPGETVDPKKQER